MIDLDKVVFDCLSFTYWIGNKYFAKSSDTPNVTYKKINREEAKNSINVLFFMKVSKPKNFKPVGNCIEILKSWNNLGFEIDFVSSRPNLKSLQKAAVLWLEQNNIQYENLIFACNNKPRFCLQNTYDFMIDDIIDNCIMSANIGNETIWLNLNDNKDIPNIPKLQIANNWDEINNIVMQKNLSQNKEI